LPVIWFWVFNGNFIREQETGFTALGFFIRSLLRNNTIYNHRQSYCRSQETYLQIFPFSHISINITCNKQSGMDFYRTSNKRVFVVHNHPSIYLRNKMLTPCIFIRTQKCEFVCDYYKLLYPVKTNLRLSYAFIIYEWCLRKTFKCTPNFNNKTLNVSTIGLPYFSGLLCCFLAALEGS